MITFLTGAPGSGKTVLAVYRMLTDDREIYTNIDVYDTSPIKFKKFIWNDFLAKIMALFPYQDEADTYIQMSKDMGIYGISIYFDECHTKLDSQKKEVVWWLSIHRHMDQNIMLITQNKGIVAQKYRLFPEIFLYAHTASMRFMASTMKYSEYSTFTMAKKDLIRRFGHKYKKEIFTYYRTGAKNKGIDTLRKKTYMILAFVLVPILAIYFFLTSFGSSSVPVSDKKNIKKIDNNTTQSKIKKTVSKWYVTSLNPNYLKIEGWHFSTRSNKVKKLLKMKQKRIRVARGIYTIYFKKSNKVLLSLLASREFSPYQHKEK